MTSEELWTELEAEFEWREAELRFLHNKVALLSDPKSRDLLRRSVVVMLYAHFEGWCRFMFALYVRAINDTGLTCGDANEAIAAASLADVFDALRDPQRKCDAFRRELPDDTALHRFARDREFVAETNALGQRAVHVPDAVVDVGGNLKPIVLQKVLFRLGLDSRAIDAVRGDVHKLLKFRNGIAHGSFKAGITAEQYSELRRAADAVVRAVRGEVTAAVRERRYRRAG